MSWFYSDDDEDEQTIGHKLWEYYTDNPLSNPAKPGQTSRQKRNLDRYRRRIRREYSPIADEIEEIFIEDPLEELEDAYASTSERHDPAEFERNQRKNMEGFAHTFDHVHGGHMGRELAEKYPGEYPGYEQYWFPRGLDHPTRRLGRRPDGTIDPDVGYPGPDDTDDDDDPDDAYEDVGLLPEPHPDEPDQRWFEMQPAHPITPQYPGGNVGPAPDPHDGDPDADNDGDDDTALHDRLFTDPIPTGTLRLPTLKWLTTVAGATLTTTITANKLLNGVAQGTDVDERIAYRIRILKIQLSGYFNVSAFNGVTAQANDMFNWAVVLDKQPNGAVASASQIWHFVTTTNHLRNLKFSKRFTVLHISRQTTNARGIYDTVGGNSSTYIERIPIEWYKKVDITTVYKDSGATITSIVKNSIYFWQWQENSNLTIASNFNFRIRYVG